MSTTDTMPSQEEMMKLWAKYSTPGAEHEWFKRLEGKWSAVVKFWMDPSAPPQEATGEAEFTLVHGGRYLLHNYKGEAMGMPFTGMGLTGYDLYRREYIDIWCDSMGSAFLISRGQGDGSGNVINYKFQMDQACMDRKDVPARSVVSFVDDDTHKIEMFHEAPDGTEIKNMESTYTRIK